MRFDFVKSLFGFKTKRRVEDIIARLESHNLRFKTLMDYVTDSVERISRAYNNKKRILNFSKGKFKQFVRKKSSDKSLLGLIAIQLSALHDLENFFQEIYNDLSSVVKINPFETSKVIVDFHKRLGNQLSLIMEYKVQLQKQEHELKRSEDLENGTDKALWDEGAQVNGLNEFIKGFDNPKRTLESDVHYAKKAKEIFDQFSKPIKDRIKSTNDTISYLNKQFYDNRKAGLQSWNDMNTHWQENYVKNILYLQRDILELNSLFAQVYKADRDNLNPLEKWYEEEFGQLTKRWRDLTKNVSDLTLKFWNESGRHDREGGYHPKYD